MTPYVCFQVAIIELLFRLLESEPDYLRRLIERCKRRKTELAPNDRAVLVAEGLTIPKYPKEQWDTEQDLLDIIKEQIDDTGSKIKIRNLLGRPLFYCGPTVGLAEYVRERGGGANRLRTNRAAQPGALHVGDILGNGDRMLSPPREGGNGVVLLHLTGGFRGHWISVPARIPIALIAEADKAIPGLVEA